MRLCKELFLIILSMLVAGNICAQIYSPASHDSFPAAYNSPGDTDMVFVYNRLQYKAELSVSITALSADRQTGWNFQWAVWNPVILSYSDLPGSDSGSFSELDTLTVTSGYQVTMSKGAASRVYRVWLIFNDFQVRITNKDGDNKLLFGYYNCSSLDLRAEATRDSGYYFNPVTHQRINIFNDFSIRWRTDNSEASVPSSRLITRVNSPPSADTWYFLNLTDRFGLIRRDSVFYKSIQSDAKINGNYVNLSDSSEYPDKSYGDYYNDGGDEKNRSAPAKYKFDISASRNSTSYKIDFGDGEILETDSVGKDIIHEFKIPKTYRVVLTTRSEKPYECPDTATYEAVVAYGSIDMPNFFTPNGSGQNDKIGSNDFFRSEDVSVVTIDITIFDRAGLKVHTYSGNIRDWEGWDGHVMKSNREAPEGVYFYVISALFYYKDPVKGPISKKLYHGFFHLYR